MRDPRDKVITLRWPTSADGKWFWKSDTSSDELDGHYFLYACYYDLVADSDAERQRVRDVVVDMTDHLLDHNFNLIDHDGKPTCRGQFGPATLNKLGWIEERGLNSLSILSYLAVAEHMTGQKRFHDAFHYLVHDQAYLANLEIPKMQSGPATGNQSDDEMAFMCYFNLLRCGTDPEVRQAANVSLRCYWSLEEPERSPLFNYIFAAVYERSGRMERPAPETCMTNASIFSSAIRSTGWIGDSRTVIGSTSYACRGFKGGTTKRHVASSAPGSLAYRRTLYQSLELRLVDDRWAGQRTVACRRKLVSFALLHGALLRVYSRHDVAAERRHSQGVARSGEALITARSVEFLAERKPAHAFFDRTRRLGFSRVESSLSRNRTARS